VASFVQWPTSRTFTRRLDEMVALAKPGSQAVVRARDDIGEIVRTGNREGLLAGTDRYGRAMTPLAESTLRRRRGSGPPLVPRGSASRPIRNFVLHWVAAASGWVMVAGWTGMARGGKPWMQYHITGGRRLPRRDPAGIRPRHWNLIRARIRKLGVDILRHGTRG
jgi:hypothetical protein